MIVNKITTLRSSTVGSVLSEQEIQDHLSSMNSDGWRLVVLDNLVGWYRFFWEKEASE